MLTTLESHTHLYNCSPQLEGVRHSFILPSNIYIYTIVFFCGQPIYDWNENFCAIDSGNWISVPDKELGYLHHENMLKLYSLQDIMCYPILYACLTQILSSTFGQRPFMLSFTSYSYTHCIVSLLLFLCLLLITHPLVIHLSGIGSGSPDVYVGGGLSTMILFTSWERWWICWVKIMIICSLLGWSY